MAFALEFHAIDRLPQSDRLRSSVVLLHGYAAAAHVHRDDARAFVGKRTEVVMPDAPGHGSRDDGRLERLAALPDDCRHAEILAIAREWRDELPTIVTWCRDRGAERVAVVGVSMGGFAALGALTGPSRLTAVAAVLAGPTLVDRAAVRPGVPPLLLGLAGRDTAVPPGPGREFAAAYGAELHEYPDSEHCMRGADWLELWAHTAAFLRRHLTAE